MIIIVVIDKSQIEESLSRTKNAYLRYVNS